MSKQIYNMGIYGGILKIIKESGDTLSEKDEAHLQYLESLPKNEWIDLDENGMAITKEQADINFQKHLSRFTPKNNE